MESFFHVHESHHLKACTLVSRTTEAKTVILFSFLIDGAHASKINNSPRKTKVNIVQTGQHLKSRNVTYRTTEFKIVLL
jgi:hypothetical protein